MRLKGPKSSVQCQVRGGMVEMNETRLGIRMRPDKKIYLDYSHRLPPDIFARSQWLGMPIVKSQLSHHRSVGLKSAECPR